MSFRRKENGGSLKLNVKLGAYAVLAVRELWIQRLWRSIDLPLFHREESDCVSTLFIIVKVDSFLCFFQYCQFSFLPEFSAHMIV